MTAKASYHFAGKTILITGGAGDIGRATAHRFAADGAGVVLLDLNEAKMADVTHELEALKIPVASFRCNVKRSSIWQAMQELLVLQIWSPTQPRSLP